MDLRVFSFNIHKGVGWNGRTPTLERIHAQLKELNSDIIFLQEIRGSQFDFITKEFWPHYRYGKNVIYQTDHHGNAILSKYPIFHSDNIDLSMSRYEKRGLLHCMAHLNETTVIHLMCVHLGLFKRYRRKQLAKIVEHIETHVPNHEPIILAGDFNDWNRSATKTLVNDLEFQEAFLNCHGDYAKTFPAWAPMLCLDRLYFRHLHASKAHSLSHKPWKFLSDHLPLEALLQTESKTE